MAERPDPDTDPNTLAEYFVEWADSVDPLWQCGFCSDNDALRERAMNARAAADGLRQLAALTTAIGDPDELTFIAGRCLDEAMACVELRAKPLGGFKSEAYLHGDRVPLAEANLDKVTRRENLAAQGRLFQGCNPFDCPGSVAAHEGAGDR